MVRIGLVVLALCLVAVPRVWSDNPPAASPGEEPERILEDRLQLLQRLQDQGWEALAPPQAEALGGAFGEGHRRIVGTLRPQVGPPIVPAYRFCLAEREPGAPQAGSGEADLCEVGRQLSRMQPCRTPQDCEALMIWRRQLGEPGLRAAEPRLEPPAWVEKTSSQKPAGDRH